MTDIETQVRAALAKLRARSAPEMPGIGPSDVLVRRVQPIPARTRAPRADNTRDSWDSVAGRCQGDAGKFADLQIGGDTVTVRIAKVSGMTGRATVQRTDTREVLTDIEAVSLANRRDVE